MGKNSKWVVRWNTPAQPVTQTPLEIVIETAPADAPTEVEVQVWESDSMRYELDDYTGDAPDLLDPPGEPPKKKPKKTDRDRDEVDDHVASFRGILEQHPARPDGRLFKRSTGSPRYTANQGNDHVWVLFEGEPASAKTELAIPGTGYEADPEDGRFYELYFVLLDPENDEVLTVSEAHFVRRRTDVLLRIEPLNQGNASLSGTGVGDMILEHFHDGDTATSNRQWGSTVVAVRSPSGPAKVGSMGCSYTTLTMILRYLRVPAAQGAIPAETTWESLYDRTAGKTLPDPQRPLRDCDLVPRQKDADAALASRRDALKALQQVPKVKKVEFAPLVDSDYQPYPEPDPAGVFNRSDIPTHFWVPRVIWWVRTLVGAPGTKVATRAKVKLRITYDDGPEQIEEAVDTVGNCIDVYGLEQEIPSPEHTDDDWRVLPFKSGVKSALGLRVTDIALNRQSAHDWRKRVTQHIDKGLPVVAQLAGGRYNDGKGGHFTLIVGYRTFKNEIRFILNDPAGRPSGLQYECTTEKDVSPQGDKNVCQIATLKVSIIDEGSQEVGTAEFDAPTMDAVTRNVQLPPPYDAEQIDLRFAGTTGRVKITSVRLRVFEDGEVKAIINLDVDLDDLRVEMKSKKKKDWEEYTTQSGTKLRFGVTGTYMEGEGPVHGKEWEGLHDVMVDRLKGYSCRLLYLVEPTDPWVAGAAQFVRFDGQGTNG